MVRPPKRILLSQEIKDFVRKNRHPKIPLWIALIGRKVSKEEWKIEGMIKIKCDTVCPQNSKPLKGITQGKEKVLGLVHSHPEQLTIPSFHDQRKHPINKLCILLGRNEPSYWIKIRNALLEIKTE